MLRQRGKRGISAPVRINEFRAKNERFPLCPQGGSARGDPQHAIEALLTEAANQNGIVLANLPAGPPERRIAFAVGLTILGIAAAVAPFASMPLSRIDAWTPITNVCFHR